MSKQITKGARSPLAEAIRSLRKSVAPTQTSFAQMVNLPHQSSISRWENDIDKPPASVLLKLSDLAPLADRQWWRDRAAEQAGIEAIVSNTSGALEIPLHFRMIPLLLNSARLGQMATPALDAVEQNLHFPPELFPEGGKIEAVRIDGAGTAKLLAIVDVSRHDADRLVGEMVAARTATGIEVRWLECADGVYLLMPFHPSQQIRRMKHTGEGSIAGAVRWVGTSITPRSVAGKESKAVR